MKFLTACRTASCLAVLVIAARVDAEDWPPIDPKELALTAPVVEKDADAEAMAWDIKIDQHAAPGGASEDRREHYLRIKVFTAAGKDSQERVNLGGEQGFAISDIEARTIRPDGTAVELAKGAVSETRVPWGSRTYVKTASFVLPDVRPGSILEYRWRETRSGFSAAGILTLQREIPVRTLRCTIHGYARSSAANLGDLLTISVFHATPQWTSDGVFRTATLLNVPSFRREPHTPSERDASVWMSLRYVKTSEETPSVCWKNYGHRLYADAKPRITPDSNIRQVAQKLVEGATSDDDKLDRLYQFCRREIHRRDDPKNWDEREAANNASAPDTLKQRTGTRRAIASLFASLATAAGFEARMAATTNRMFMTLDEEFCDPNFLTTLVAVRRGDGWRLFDPAFDLMPPDVLHWAYQGEKVLISDPDEPTFIPVPATPAEKSRGRRRADLRLSEDGTLEGDVRAEYWGQRAIAEKERYASLTPEERVGQFSKTPSGADVSDLHMDGTPESDDPWVVTYHVRVPGFAQRSGKHLVFAPAFFERHATPWFPSSERRLPMLFRYASTDEQHVSIALPAGYELDQGEAPSPISAPPVGDYSVRIRVTDAPAKILYDRSFSVVTTAGPFLFPATQYATVKAFFDAVLLADHHTLAIVPHGGP